MIYIPAGQFLRGAAEDDDQADDDEKPRRAIHLDAFWIDQSEVTNARFAVFIQQTGYRTQAERRGSGRVLLPEAQEEMLPGADWQHPHGPQSSISGLDEHPVVQVSWDDAAAYCAWAGARLPGEAEWEKAARGEDAFIYPWGNTFDGRILNFCERNCSLDWANPDFDDGWSFTAPAGSYPAGASPYGLLDMSGNVWEWVQDRYGAGYYASAPADNPYGPATGSLRILRGGAWGYQDWSARLTNRSAVRPSMSDDDVGFRCAWRVVCLWHF